MPGGDGTGPMGFGPRTGRAAGYCSGYSMPGFANPRFGRRFWGRYPGPGVAPAAPVDEKAMLKQQAEFLKEQISMLEARLKEIESSGTDD